MSKVKSFSVGDGDMFYIKHGSDNFTTIDCCLSDENKVEIVNELKDESSDKNVTRFISTHPDEDHIQKIDYLDDNMPIVNFYCVKNEATKKDETDGFKRYKKLRDGEKAYYVYRGCKRKWMNESGDGRDCAGINFQWPKTDNEDFKQALEEAKNGESPNNISPIFTYGLNDSATIIWMGDLYNEFMTKIVNEIELPKVNILFAPHHGRKSGKVPSEWLEQMNPDIIVMGEAPSENLDYAGYDGYNKITQNSAGDIIFDCLTKKVNVYVSNENYSVDFLDDENLPNKYDCYYLGTLNL
jgi:beta-lactamase superfamily II metal-dependent hydrolase